mmetsp:Transcript_38178/g.107875  ORF Transcript_38178/g.107875 Transcript_38178/m.107875 type:complete len:490 (+) Transcript_38178:357-1826(+)|eukprot:CAMPEP_0117684320 /NCGR_PEP_ID=MMETSP0804-20121206/21010_1 /TAXON_ID=1074897 /ORGANISM="Tetraselmis astigmatica, Strain CCMP880" /LENGTH=489 /DNA_ID=CAMNT_0005495251 /DNA_START=274 /DNA_END=1743 /DNA_ORIENTATION=-
MVAHQAADRATVPLLGERRGSDRASWLAIYSAHFLRSWSERAWEFAIGLILLSLKPDTLWLVAAYGLTENLVITLLGPWVGAWLDRQDRQLWAALVVFQCQNLGNLVSASIATAALWQGAGLQGPYAASIIVAMVSASCFARLASTVATLSVERKWVKILCKDDPEERTAQVCSELRRIDLVCLFAAPIFTGCIMTVLSPAAASLALAVWNACTWIPSVVLLKLSVRWSAHSEFLTNGNPGADQGRRDPTPSQERQVLSDPSAGAAPAPSTRVSAAFVQSGTSLATYFRQHVALPGLALSMLYFSVMSLGLIMTSYLKWQGISEAEISAFRGIGASVSVLSTFSFPALHAVLGAKAAGGLGIFLQVSCLVVATIFMFRMSCGPHGGKELLYLALGFLMLSRWGLWTFDLAVTQQIQTDVEEDLLGIVNGVQASLQNLFELAIGCVTVVVSDPQDFVWLALLSTVQVAVAMLLYLGHWLLRRPGRAPQPD